ncbi:MAG: MATE family efflux transporter, partial [Lachnospiraceae bacterium]|nr:MATE family efflux transporter [Lachnospiraceae bacterium]
MLRELREKFIGDRDFYRRYIYLAVPMIIQNAITNFVSFLDNIMVGQLGEEAISAVATVNQLVFIFYLSVFGVAAAGGIYGAQFYGKKDHTGHMYSFRFKLYAVIVVAVIGISLFLNFGENFISLFLTETDGNISKALATDYGLKYLNIILIGLPPFA